jgi:hypothetical protein
MRKKSWIVWLIIVAAAFVVVEINPQIVPTVENELKETSSKIQPYVYLIKSNMDKKISEKTETKSKSDNQVSGANTPIEEPLRGMHTSSTYYYHFKKNVPESVRKVFETAIASYNSTGIVKLIPGEAQPNQNNITFFIYHKKIDNIASNSVELGNGGPSALQLNDYAINSGRAGLNMSYPDLSVQESVAMHELGHA